MSISSAKNAPKDLFLRLNECYAKGPQLWMMLLDNYLKFFDEKMTEEECIWVEDEYAEELLSLMSCIDRGLTRSHGKEHPLKRCIDGIRSSIYNTVEEKKRFQ